MRSRLVIWLLLLSMSLSLSAAPRLGTRTTHWLGLALTGFEATPIIKSDYPIHPKAGGGGQAALLYELHHGRFIFNIGLGADYTLTNTTLDGYSDAFPRVDFEGDPLTYRYIYSAFHEQQTQLRLTIPMQVAYRIGDWLYAGVGASFRLKPLNTAFISSTQMLTEGDYNSFIDPIRNTDKYGYWAEQTYQGKGQVVTAANEVAVEAEFGARVPLAPKVQMRAGIYLGYDIPILNATDAIMTLADYSAVDTNPFTQSLQDLQTNLRFNSLLDSNLLTCDAQRLRVGIRITFLFNVSHTPKHCMCDTE